MFPDAVGIKQSEVTATISKIETVVLKPLGLIVSYSVVQEKNQLTNYQVIWILVFQWINWHPLIV